MSLFKQNQRSHDHRREQSQNWTAEFVYSKQLSDRPLYCISQPTINTSNSNKTTSAASKVPAKISATIVTGGADHGLHQILAGTGEYVRELYTKTSGHTEWVTSVLQLDDGRVVSGGMDGKVCVWDGIGSNVNGPTGGIRDSGIPKPAPYKKRDVKCIDLNVHRGSITEIRKYCASNTDSILSRHPTNCSQNDSTSTPDLVAVSSYDGSISMWDFGKSSASRPRHLMNLHQDIASASYATDGDSLESYLSNFDGNGKRKPANAVLGVDYIEKDLVCARTKNGSLYVFDLKNGPPLIENQEAESSSLSSFSSGSISLARSHGTSVSSLSSSTSSRLAHSTRSTPRASTSSLHSTNMRQNKIMSIQKQQTPHKLPSTIIRAHMGAISNTIVVDSTFSPIYKKPITTRVQQQQDKSSSSFPHLLITSGESDGAVRCFDLSINDASRGRCVAKLENLHEGGVKFMVRLNRRNQNDQDEDADGLASLFLATVGAGDGLVKVLELSKQSKSLTVHRVIDLVSSTLSPASIPDQFNSSAIDRNPKMYTVGTKTMGTKTLGKGLTKNSGKSTPSASDYKGYGGKSSNLKAISDCHKSVYAITPIKTINGLILSWGDGRVQVLVDVLPSGGTSDLQDVTIHELSTQGDANIRNAIRCFSIIEPEVQQIRNSNMRRISSSDIYSNDDTANSSCIQIFGAGDDGIIIHYILNSYL
jgi:hypothetical protein